MDTVRFFTQALLLSALLASAAPVCSAEETALPEHPRLLLTKQGIEAVKARIEKFPWARKRWEALLGEADGLLTQEVVLPPRGGNWWHWYVCPEHGAVLKQGKQIGPWQWEHLCSIDGKVFLGDATKPERDFDGCILSGLHGDWADRLRLLGVAYQVTGDARYAAKARDIMMAYAAAYPTYPLHTIRGEAKIGGGRTGPQSLDESTWLIPLCQGADLVWDALDETDQRLFADQVVLPAVREVILPHKMGVHNIQCWKNSAVGVAGLLLGDGELVSEAIDNADRGYTKQMAEGVGPDGQWWEGAWGYHFYTLMALWGFAEAAHNCGIDLYGAPLKAMFDAPLKLAMPDLRLPAFNDSGEADLRGEAWLYELAYARFADPAYAKVLAGSDRSNDFALWYGADEIPEAAAASWISTDYPTTGYAILARGDGEQATWLCLKYGPHGGGHGHPDKLGFVLYAQGAVVAPDPGTARYGTPLQGSWYRTTFAHSTLIVDQASQRQAQGSCLAFGSEKGVDFAMADAGPIDEGVRFVRTAALISTNLLVFIDQIACDRERLLDVAYHEVGTWDNLPPGDAWTVPDQPGYQHLRDAASREADADIALTVAKGERKHMIALAGGVPTEVVTATGIGDNIEDRVPVVLFRRHAQATAFAWCVALDGVAPQFEPVVVHEDSGEPVPTHQAAAWRIVHGAATDRVLVVNPDKRALRIALPDGSEVQTAAAIAVY